MALSRMRRSTRSLVAGAALVGTLSGGATVAATVMATPAFAQTTIDPNDFIDPTTGQFDLEAYLAAVAAANASTDTTTGSATGGGTSSGGRTATATRSTSGSLPYTGSSTGDLAAGGLAVLVTGGAVVAVAANRRRHAADAPVDVTVG